jgi:hypothetical protein
MPTSAPAGRAGGRGPALREGRKAERPANPIAPPRARAQKTRATPARTGGVDVSLPARAASVARRPDRAWKKSTASIKTVGKGGGRLFLSSFFFFFRAATDAGGGRTSPPLSKRKQRQEGHPSAATQAAHDPSSHSQGGEGVAGCARADRERQEQPRSPAPACPPPHSPIHPSITQHQQTHRSISSRLRPSMVGCESECCVRTGCKKEKGVCVCGRLSARLRPLTPHHTVYRTSERARGGRPFIVCIGAAAGSEKELPPVHTSTHRPSHTHTHTAR